MNTGTLSARVDHHAVCGCGCVLRVRMCWHQTQICQAQHNTDMGNEKGGHSFEHELFVLRVSLSLSHHIRVTFLVLPFIVRARSQHLSGPWSSSHPQSNHPKTLINRKGRPVIVKKAFIIIKSLPSELHECCS